VSFVLGGLSASALVLDANILVRAVLGRRARALLERYAASVSLLTVGVALADAQAYVPGILARRGLSPEIAAQASDEVFGRLPNLVHLVPHEIYAGRETEARQRLRGRDESDWPFVALALTFDCPIWTEDQDFFGSGVPTWTTDRVEIYLAAESAAES
jgi:predicted nucleic acid-binding protein